MVMATLLWGATFVVIRDSVRAIPPLTLVAARFAVAALVGVLVLMLGRVRIDRDALIGGVPAAVRNAELPAEVEVRPIACSA